MPHGYGTGKADDNQGPIVEFLRDARRDGMPVSWVVTSTYPGILDVWVFMYGEPMFWEVKRRGAKLTTAEQRIFDAVPGYCYRIESVTDARDLLASRTAAHNNSGWRPHSRRS